MWWLVALAAAGWVGLSVGRTVWREWVATERLRDEEWALALEAAKVAGWPPYTPLGLSRRAELEWRATWLRTAPHCELYERADGTTEWVHIGTGNGAATMIKRGDRDE